MAVDVGGDERAEWDHVEAPCPDVVERVSDETGPDAGAFGCGRHLGVDEDDQARLGAVADRADQLAVSERFVAELGGVVSYRHNAHVDIIAVVLIVGSVVATAVLVLGMFIWGAVKDGEEDKAVQARLGIRRRTRLGR